MAEEIARALSLAEPSASPSVTRAICCSAGLPWDGLSLLCARLPAPDRGWYRGVPRGRGLDPLDLSGRPVPGWLRAVGLHGPAPNTPACSRPSHGRSGRPSRIGTVDAAGRSV